MTNQILETRKLPTASTYAWQLSSYRGVYPQYLSIFKNFRKEFESDNFKEMFPLLLIHSEEEFKFSISIEGIEAIFFYQTRLINNVFYGSIYCYLKSPIDEAIKLLEKIHFDSNGIAIDLQTFDGHPLYLGTPNGLYDFARYCIYRIFSE